MATMSEASTALSAGRRGLGRDLAGLAVILVLAGIGYLLFPNNLALLTRITAIALLVLSLDLVTGYCGVATLGHAALFGSGAYAAGIAAVHFGITDPLLMLAAGILGVRCGARLRGRDPQGARSPAAGALDRPHPSVP